MGEAVTFLKHLEEAQGKAKVTDEFGIISPR